MSLAITGCAVIRGAFFGVVLAAVSCAKPIRGYADANSGLEAGSGANVVSPRVRVDGGRADRDAEVPLAEPCQGDCGAACIGLSCVAAPPATARCEAGGYDEGSSTPVASDRCPLGAGFNPLTMDCESCGGLMLGCGDSDGELSGVLSTGAGECVCETMPGYYVGADGRAQPCDADADGWVTISAQPAIEGQNAVMRLNARCDVKRVRQIVGESEAGKVAVVADDLAAKFPGDDTAGIPPGLPLYESDRNDGTATAEPIPTYYGAEVGPEVVNGLTRACTSVGADFNDNGVADLDEWSGREPTFGSGDARSTYVAEYTRFSYLIELFGASLREVDALWLTERSRQPEATGFSVAVRYPDELSSYSASCERGQDELVGDEDVANPVGVDFQSETGGVLLHGSQYKCVALVSEAEYAQTGLTAESTPQRLSVSAAGDIHWKRRNATQLLPLHINDCSYRGAVEAKESGAVPRFACELAPEGTVTAGTVRLAAVGFIPYQQAYLSPAERGDYVRGCFDECVQSSSAPENACQLCVVGRSGAQSVGSQPRTSCEDGCHDGQCYAECNPGADTYRCGSPERSEHCDAGGIWQAASVCTHGCNMESGRCYPECVPGARQCSGAGVPQTCTAVGDWADDTACASPDVCVREGECETPAPICNRILESVSCDPISTCSEAASRNAFAICDAAGCDHSEHTSGNTITTCCVDRGARGTSADLCTL